MTQDPANSQPVSTSPSPPVGRPVIGSRLLTVEHRAWQLLGASLGPVRSTVLRLTVTLGVDCVVERVDGQPLGDLAEQFREQIAAARAQLEERLRRSGTATWKRETVTAPIAAPVAMPATAPVAVPVAVPVAAPVAQPARVDVQPSEHANPQKTTSSVFRCERQVITDRITKLRKETPAPPSAAEAEEAALAARRAEQQLARERLAEIRAKYWETHREQQADNLAPSPAAPGTDDEPTKIQHTSSVFRVDRGVITDRIERLKRKADTPTKDEPPAGQGSPG